jgi:hypothetical protein
LVSDLDLSLLFHASTLTVKRKGSGFGQLSRASRVALWMGRKALCLLGLRLRKGSSDLEAKEEEVAVTYP